MMARELVVPWSIARIKSDICESLNGVGLKIMDQSLQITTNPATRIARVADHVVANRTTEMSSGLIPKQRLKFQMPLCKSAQPPDILGQIININDETKTAAVQLFLALNSRHNDCPFAP